MGIHSPPSNRVQPTRSDRQFAPGHALVTCTHRGPLDAGARADPDAGAAPALHGQDPCAITERYDQDASRWELCVQTIWAILRQV